ncbi:DNA ligase [Bacteriophage DSS3_MAL1]|nr:DNA ligase [Bacteriophage DSS3_MAL1]
MNIEVVGRPTELYKRGTKGEVRVWRMEEGLTEDGRGAHRVVSGIKDGTMTESGWTITEPKNVGKKNATTSIEQARSEILNNYKIKSERGYFADIDEIDNVPFTKPMLAVDIDKRRGKFNTEDGVFAQPKLDGIRCIARVDGLFTRTGKPITALPHIVEALAPYFKSDPDLVLDGELYNHDLKDDFNTITSIVRKAKPSEEDIEKAKKAIEYHIYDMPSHAGTFSERREALLDLFETGLIFHGGLFQRVETVFVDSDDKLDDLYAAWLEEGYEGQMIRLDGEYQFKRSNFLMKRKDFITMEFRVKAVHEGLGNWMGYIKRFELDMTPEGAKEFSEVYGVSHPEGTACGAGVRGTQAALKALLDSGETPDWATVRFFTPTPDGMPRFPVVIDWGKGSRAD